MPKCLQRHFCSEAEEVSNGNWIYVMEVTESLGVTGCSYPESPLLTVTENPSCGRNAAWLGAFWCLPLRSNSK